MSQNAQVYYSMRLLFCSVYNKENSFIYFVFPSASLTPVFYIHSISKALSVFLRNRAWRISYILKLSKNKYLLLSTEVRS